MGALGSKLRTLEGGGLAFKCPGCKTGHQVNGGWSFNGDGDKPTFSPSVLVTGIRADLTEEQFNRAVALPKEVDRTTHPEFGMRCHSFVRDGMIQFLDDCHHNLKNTTVPLPNWDGSESPAY